MISLTPEHVDRIFLTLDSVDEISETGYLYSARVTVTNQSEVVLGGLDLPVNFSYHWQDADTGEMTIYDGERTELKPALQPGAARQFEIAVRAPETPGRYRLIPAMVQEFVTWIDGGPDTALKTLPVFEVDRRPWWTPESKSSNLFGAHEILNSREVSRRLTHQGHFRPRLIFCETVSICNLSCIVCSYEHHTRPKTTMPLALFQKVLQDYSAMGGGLLSLTPTQGDVLLDKWLVERLKMAEEYSSIQELSFTTNAVMAKLYSDEELDYIVNRMRTVYISVYGLEPEEFRVMTEKDTYEEMVRQTNRILEVARNRVVLGFRTLKAWPRERELQWVESLSGMRATRAEVTVHGNAVDAYGNWGVLDASQPLPFDAKWAQIEVARTQCAVPAMGLRIYSNGNVSFCSCNDYDNDPELHLGSVAETSLLDLYNSEKNWKLWNWDRHGVPAFCRRCTFYKPIEEFRDRLFTNLFIMEA